MRIRTFASVGLIGLALAAAACNQTEAPKPADPAPSPAPPSPSGPTPAPVADDGFKYAAVYTCGGAEILVDFDREHSKARVKMKDGAVLDLPSKDDPANAMTYTDGKATFAMDKNGQEKFAPAGGASSACEAVSRDVPPPVIAGVTRDIGEADAGKTIEFKVGDKFSVSLVGVPTAGYVWSADTVPAFLTKKEEAGGATTTAQFTPGFAGGNHWEVTAFEATKAGSGDLELVQKRPWEQKADPDDKRFKVKIVVK